MNDEFNIAARELIKKCILLTPTRTEISLSNVFSLNMVGMTEPALSYTIPDGTIQTKRMDHDDYAQIDSYCIVMYRYGQEIILQWNIESRYYYIDIDPDDDDDMAREYNSQFIYTVESILKAAARVRELFNF